MRDLLAELNRILEEKRECICCSVVETRGSTPQKAGATMLVFPDGGQIGTLGGGCVEAEVRQRALRSFSSGKTELHVFHLDDNYGWDDGLICGGRMSILAQPLLPTSTSEEVGEYFRRLKELAAAGTGHTQAVVLADAPPPLQFGNRYLFDATGNLVAQIGAGVLPEVVTRHLTPVQQRPKPKVHDGIAYLPVPPRVTLLIVGGGHVGEAVARLAAEVDFDIWILDDRERYASQERFPMAKRRIVGDIGASLQRLVAEAIDPSFFCVIVTRGHAHDEEALFHLAPSNAAYVGMIGSKRKKKLIYEDLMAKGIPEATLAKVHSPVGLEIGSQTVPEIAISIVAELIACRNLAANPASR
ncbi:MAG: xanthine dehydrogenase [Gemmatales bacterium]|nr:MAG: xanthine dehydrogenase [Gemmatales bacterium]